MRLQWLRLELRVKLAADKMWMVGEFNNLHVSSIRSRTGDAQSRGDHRLFIFPVKFVAMAMALADFKLAVNLMRQGTGLYLASPRTETHRAPEFFNST